jgi:repressor of nif and glnA expression
MAKKTTGPNKSEEVRQLLKANPKMTAKEIVSTLAGKKIDVTESLVYFVKGKMKGRKTRKQRVAKAAVTTNGLDTVSTILKVKNLASELGGMGKLKAMVEALG